MTQFLQSHGWRRRGTAALLGLCATLALPPFFMLPLLIPALGGLLLLTLHANSKRQAFWDGWWWGLGHFTTGLYWICISLYVDPTQFAWLTPFALFGLPSVLAIYTGLAMLAFHYLSPQIRSKPYTLSLVFAALWITAEYLRSTLFTGFPWNLIGYAWNASTTTMQTASLWGILGQSWVAVLVATLPAMYFLPGRPTLKPAIAALALLMGIVVFGQWRLATHPTEFTDVKLRIVQANIPQSLKFDRNSMMEGLRRHIELSQSTGMDELDVVLWPETSIPYMLEPNSPLARDIGASLPSKTLLLSGGMHEQGKKQEWEAWNSGFAINHKGEIIAQYDKHHLVPFGEFIPFRETLQRFLPIENIAGGLGDWSRGRGAATLIAGKLPPFSLLICYEAIFPEEAINHSQPPQWLVNITNDAWFGISTGPYQHLEMARLRSVEQGLPLVRAANTGISALFDSYGRVIKTLPLNTSGVLDGLLPKPAPSHTPFSRIWSIFILLSIMLISSILIIVSKLLK